MYPLNRPEILTAILFRVSLPTLLHKTRLRNNKTTIEKPLTAQIKTERQREPAEACVLRLIFLEFDLRLILVEEIEVALTAGGQPGVGGALEAAALR